MSPSDIGPAQGYVANGQTVTVFGLWSCRTSARGSPPAAAGLLAIDRKPENAQGGGVGIAR